MSNFSHDKLRQVHFKVIRVSSWKQSAVVHPVLHYCYIHNEQHCARSTNHNSNMWSPVWLKTPPLHITVVLGETHSLSALTGYRRTAAISWRQRGAKTPRTHPSLNSQRRVQCSDLRRGRGGQEHSVHLCFCHGEQTEATVWVCVSVRAVPNTHKHTSGWWSACTNAHRLVPTQLA